MTTSLIVFGIICALVVMCIILNIVREKHIDRKVEILLTIDMVKKNIFALSQGKDTHTDLRVFLRDLSMGRSIDNLSQDIILMHSADELFRAARWLRIAARINPAIIADKTAHNDVLICAEELDALARERQVIQDY